jgi:hypothetical protein
LKEAIQIVPLRSCAHFGFGEGIAPKLDRSIKPKFQPQFSPPDGNMNDGGQFGKVTTLRFDSQRESQVTLRVGF